jgi:hypothetical protein
MLLVRYLDVALVIIGGAVAIALGGPALGCAVGGGAWILQRILAVVDARWTRRLREPRQQLGVNLFERFGRIWLLAGAIVVAGVAGGRSDGLAAAVIIFVAYTIVFVTRLVSGPPSPPPPRSEP